MNKLFLHFRNKLHKKIQQDRATNVLNLIDGSNNKILELGTGNGRLFQRLKERGENIIGLDVNPKKELLKKGFDIRGADLNKKIPFPDKTFDVVLAIEIIEHLFNPYEIMKEIRRVLKPRGFAIISMPNTANIFYRIGQLYEIRMEEFDIYWHHHQPCIKSIKNLISKELKIEKEVYTLNFKKMFILNFLSGFLMRISKNWFCAQVIIKARK